LESQVQAASSEKLCIVLVDKPKMKKTEIMFNLCNAPSPGFILNILTYTWEKFWETSTSFFGFLSKNLNNPDTFSSTEIKILNHLNAVFNESFVL